MFNTTSPPVSHDHPSGPVPSATSTEYAVSAEIFAGARRSLRLQGLPPTTIGRERHAGSLSHVTDETSSAVCVLHNLDEVASTPLCEPRSSLHDDCLPFDLASHCCTGPSAPSPWQRSVSWKRACRDLRSRSFACRKSLGFSACSYSRECWSVSTSLMF